MFCRKNSNEEKDKKNKLYKKVPKTIKTKKEREFFSLKKFCRKNLRIKKDIIKLRKAFPKEKEKRSKKIAKIIVQKKTFLFSKSKRKIIKRRIKLRFIFKKAGIKFI